MRIVQVSSEVAPFSKSGGLADVVGSLGPALVRSGHQVMTVSPWYRQLADPRLQPVDTGVTFGFHAAGARHDVRFLTRVHEGVQHVFVDHPMFDRAGLYGDLDGAFGDNHLRFSVLARAAIEAARRVPFMDGEPLGEGVVFHVHDWPAALLPVYLEVLYRPLGLFPRAAVVATIHNLKHQGRFPADAFADLELPPRLMTPQGLGWHGDINLLKGGLTFADELTTVSPTHAREITTPDLGFGLDALLRARRDRLTGILNGIDTNTWDPVTDPHLPAPFDADDLSGKASCKAALQAELGLKVDGSVPLIGSVGRLDPQKGIDLLVESIPWMAQEGAQVVVLGSAAAEHRYLEERLAVLERVWPRNVRVLLGFDEGKAHRISAGSDLFVMPSYFEPCGLSQMIAMRYGSAPIVRYTGGLADTVQTFDPGRNQGTGWTFDAPTGWAFREAVHWAMATWRDYPGSFAELRRRGMSLDFSWDASVPAYVSAYERALSRR